MRLMLGAMLVLAVMVVLPADAQQPQSQPNCTPGRDLITIPEIKRQDNGRLLGTIVLADEQRSIPGAGTGTPCNWQPLRYFKGVSGLNPTPPWPTGGEPIPGPTLRARVGDVVQLAFLNQINTANFPNTLDQAEQGKTDGCDSATATRLLPPAGRTAQIYPRTDAYPNCLHGSSTANIHFHGTHTTPGTTGDNVLLYIRPALRPAGRIEPANDFVMKQFADFFKWCDANGFPTKWEQMPGDWQKRQRELLQQYDATAPYKGVPGALPDPMKLWPRNDAQIRNGHWPQYSIGAYPHCFPLPAYDPAKVKMGQSPGTHWYHAHKHGSTALNVGNGMTGAFVIEGAYDDELRNFYKATPQHQNWGLQERVLVIQGLETALNLLSGTNLGGPPPLSVNGRLQPVITMKPGQVQMWRIVNGAARTFVQFVDQPQTTRPGPGRVLWRQIAQDGVQFSFANYQRIGTVNGSVNLAAANRADLLVRAPLADGDYAIQVVTSVSDVPAGASSPLLTVRVRRDVKQPIEPPMDFIEKEEDFPKLPPFLKDIDETIVTKRLLVFDSKPFSDRGHVSKSLGKPTMPRHEINGKLYQDDHVDQTMILDTTEEWQISNKTTNIAHPFHIHINPFQVTEIFQPNTKEASDPSNPCYADPLRPETWKPCQPLTGPFVWWDTFAIPTARQDVLPCLKVEECEPATIRPYVTCMKFPVRVGNDTKFIQQCRVTIPGYFKFKSRFVDFTGQYVLHCHILAHEDRGMMELIQVVKKPVSPYKHH